MLQSRVLLVEDDPNLGYILRENLESEGFKVDLCVDGDDGKRSFLQSSYDLCLIDVMLPKKDGFTLATEIRELNQVVPIIFLTAKSLKEDRIKGFRVGADDYVTKPFSLEELLLRIQAVLKRSSGAAASSSDEKSFSIGSYEFDYNRQLLIRENVEQKLTYKEAELLKLLCMHKNSILERRVALNLIWGDDNVFNARSMDVFITKLRKYLQGDAGIEITNVHGKGFKLLVQD
ncbi:response regulator transcription factor [bacterium]|nr:response regulator transcription factor [bacterium]